MNPRRSWLLYSLIRIGLFAVVLAVLLLLQFQPWVAAIVAAVVALCISYIFLRKPREAVAKNLYDVRHKQAVAYSEDGEDENVEDAAIADAATADAAAGTSTTAEPGDTTPKPPAGS